MGDVQFIKSLHVHQKSKMSFGVIILPEFKPDGNWNVHFQRLEQFFNANSVNNDARKISILISSIGEETYQKLQDLCDPVLPSHFKTHVELRELIEKHCASGVSVFKERKQFYNLHKLNSESINQWYERVFKSAVQCNFGTGLEERMKNQFVAGMNERKILDRLSEENHNVPLEDIVKIALEEEAINLTTIEKLPVELMIEIFSYLSVVERARIELVSKYFQEATKRSWYKVKELSIDPKFLGLKPFGI